MTRPSLILSGIVCLLGQITPIKFNIKKKIIVKKVYCKTDLELESAIAKNNYNGYYDFICATSVYGEDNAYMLMYRDEMG